MSAPPPKPAKPAKPTRPTGGGMRQLPTPGGNSSGSSPTTPIIPQGRSFRARPQSTRASPSKIHANPGESLQTNALIEQPLPALPSRPPLKLPVKPPPRQKPSTSDCETPPLTPTSARPTAEVPGRKLPNPVASLPEPSPNQPLPTPPSRQPRFLPPKPDNGSKTTPPLPSKPSLPPKPLPTPPPKSNKEEPPPLTKQPIQNLERAASSSSGNSRRVSVRNPALENVLNLRFSAGGNTASTPPKEEPATPPQEPSPSQEKRKSKLLRPSKKPKNKNKSSQVFGTLPRLMGTSKEKHQKEGEPVPPSDPISAPKRPLRSSSDVEGVAPSDPAASEESSFKWKRGAEAEAILKLINETKDSGGPAVGATVAAPSAVEALDAEAVMKILGLEEPGIKLPEKHNDGEEKALDPTSELQLTERNFIADLGLLNETFVKPVRTNNILSGHIIEAISINLDRLISLHRELYKNFINDCSLLGIATTFSDSLISELERLYTVYMGHYESSLALFHDKRDNVTQFRKYLKQREEMTDKSVTNLLVTPVQRVCKYELMLASIKKSVLKQADPNDREIHRHAELLQTKIDALNLALQNVDRRRAAADNWDKINQLEKSLLLSESLSKVGRVILKTTETTVRVGDEEKMFKLVLFNDQLIRTKVAKKSKARLLDSIPLNQLQVIDITQQDLMHQGMKADISERFSFYIIPTDPRLQIWTVHFSTETEKNEWMENLTPRVLSFDRFCDSWGISKSSNEVLVAADGGRWPQEYVNECRLFLTTYHLCILWKMFGIEERELVPIQLLSNIQQTTLGKERALRIAVSNWKQDYTFTSLQLHEHTESILTQLISKAASNTRLKAGRRETIYQSNNPFLLSPMEWNSIWSEAKTISFAAKEVIIGTSQSHPFLYQLVSGRVMANGSPPVLISKGGSLFGASSFFEESAPPFETVAGDAPVTVLQLKRDTLVSSCDANHLMKFFATLAKSLAPA